MALLEAVETGQARVVDLRTELGKVRQALDRADAVLGAADDTLAKAEVAIVQSRRVAPYVLVALGLAAAVGVTALVLARRRRRDLERAFGDEPEWDASFD
jgi:hypothetical protein